MMRVIGVLFLSFYSCVSHAQSFENILLTDSAFIGLSPGNDGLWDTGDELTLTDFNTIGAASSFGFTSSLTDNTFGFWEGTSTNTITVFPNYETTSANFTGEASCTICGPFNFINAPISATLAPGGPYTGSLTSAGVGMFNTLNQSTTTIVSSSINETVSSTTFNVGGVDFGVVLQRGQSPETVFAGNAAVISHFNFIVPLLPSNWASVATDLQSIEILDGPRAGLSGIQTLTSYTLAPVPLPPAVILLGFAILGFSFWRRAY